MTCDSCGQPATTQLTCSCGKVRRDVCDARACQPPRLVCPVCGEPARAGPLRERGPLRLGRSSLDAYTATSEEIEKQVSKGTKTTSISSECQLKKPPPKAGKLTATLLELTFQTKVLACQGGRPIEAPHWQSSLPAGELRSAVFVAANAASARASVTLRIDKADDQPKTGRLEGRLSMLRFVCEDVPLTMGTHTVEVEITNLPECIAQIHGQASWALSSDAGERFELAETLLELFVVLAAPGPSFKKAGVWVEVLDFLLTTVQLDEARITDPSDAANIITRYCHFAHRLTYDSANHYAYSTHGGRFCLSAYLDRVDAFANCYDQASAVLVLCHAIGAPMIFRYASCYGFIKTTRLLGDTETNNPGFRAAKASPIVAADSLARTGFCDHAFCTLEGKVFDACVGPHLGELTIAEYLSAAIDGSEEALGLLKKKLVDCPEENATEGDIEDGGVTILDVGFAGQVIRRNLQTELRAQGIEELLVEWVLVFAAITGKGNSGADVPAFEAILEGRLVAMMDRSPKLDERTAVQSLGIRWLRAELLGYLNRTYAAKVTPEAHKRGELKRVEEGKLATSDKDLKAKTKQCSDRKEYVEWLGTAGEFDKNEKHHGRPIYPYDPVTLDLV